MGKLIIASNQFVAQTDLEHGLESEQPILAESQPMSATILVVEHNDFLRRTLRWWLKTKFPHCYVIEAIDSEEAIHQVQANSPNIVILDITVPEGSQEIIARIKAVASMVKIVALTFREDEIDYITPVLNGVVTYISHEKIQTTLQPALVKLLSS